MRKSLSIDKKALLLYSLSALIPLLLLVGCMYLQKIYPFGDDSLILIDASSQYINYLGYFRSVLTGENSLLYTFSKNLGGDMLSLAAYYMLSPFNLLFRLASTKTLPLVFTVIVLLKLSLCGFTFYYASSRLYGPKSVNLAFSTAYALMGYTVIYEWNIMWLDGVMILPLLFWGLYRLYRDRKIGLYAFCIAYALITSFYTGYMLCASSVIFFLALLVLHRETWRSRLKKCGIFAYASCIGGFASAVVWLPAVLTLGGNRLDASGNPLAFSLRFNPLDLAAKFTAGAANTMEIYDGLPQVFCGTLVLLLVFLLFLNKDIPLRTRLTVLGVTVVFLLSFCINTLDVIWHGFSPNRLFNYRYSFLFSFVLIMAAQYSLHVQPHPSVRQLLPAAAITGGLFLLALLRQPELAGTGSAVNFIVLTLILLLFCAKQLRGKLLPVMLALITILEMGANCFLSWDRMFEGTLKLNYMDYYYYVDFAEPAIHYAKAQEDGFFRMEKTFQKDQNDAMLFGYKGLSHFSSTEPTYVMNFMEKMGFRNYLDVWSAYFLGSTADVDTLLGVKYLISTMDQSAMKGYELLTTINDVSVYRNPNALPLAILADDAIQQVSMDSDDYFSLHNTIWSGITGQEIQILQKETNAVLSLTNLTDALQDDGTHLYTKTDPAQPASMRYEITISQSLPLYYYFTAPVDEQLVTIYLNGASDGTYFDPFRWNMAYSGTYSPGDTLVIELVPANDSFTFSEGYFYYEDLDALTMAADLVKDNPVSLENVSDSHLFGSFESDSEKTLFFTIPWDEGWHLILDGTEVPCEAVLDTFLSVSVAPGSHTFALYFLPVGMLPGAALAVLSCLMALGWLAVKKGLFSRDRFRK